MFLTAALCAVTAPVIAGFRCGTAKLTLQARRRIIEDPDRGERFASYCDP